MRRDYFTLDVRGLEWVDSGESPEKPTVVIDFEGPASLLQDRVTGLSAELLDESEIDVSYRFRTEIDDPDAEGVISVTDRVTGDYVLELNADAASVLEFIHAAREYARESGNDDERYRIEILIDGERVVTYDKRTLLLYNQEGNLLRKHSLIPSGVEL